MGLKQRLQGGRRIIRLQEGGHIFQAGCAQIKQGGRIGHGTNAHAVSLLEPAEFHDGDAVGKPCQMQQLDAGLHTNSVAITELHG